MTDIIEIFKETLRENGYKLTSQRRTVLEAMYSRLGEHLTAEEVHCIVKGINSDIGLATVYRTLQLLSDLGLLDKLNLDDGIVRYEIGEMGIRHRHHHLICEVCGTIVGVEVDMLDNLESVFYERYGFTVTNHILKCYGTCKNCEAKTKA